MKFKLTLLKPNGDIVSERLVDTIQDYDLAIANLLKERAKKENKLYTYDDETSMSPQVEKKQREHRSLSTTI